MLKHHIIEINQHTLIIKIDVTTLINHGTMVDDKA
jgi:hypothetical protein